jgi:dolichol-phosphate mannosyltransferase
VGAAGLTGSRPTPGGADRSLWVVLPTYNEAQNIRPFVSELLRELAEVVKTYTILIVDDSSPDGTGEIADRLSTEMATLDVLHRSSKRGLGPAYLAGFSHALERGAGVVVQMDSDFSHDPADIGRLVAALQSSDVVLGSRYVTGGAIEGWGRLRRVVSALGCWYARKVLRVPVRDLTGGFKCFRREALVDVLEGIRVLQSRTNGYAFQVETTYRALLRGHKVYELPIVFRDRRAGASKMTWRIALEAVWRVPALVLATGRPARMSYAAAVEGRPATERRR